MNDDDYGKLTRLAFLLLGDSANRRVDAEDKLARAHRIARAATRWPHTGRSYEQARRRVLRHILRREPRPRPARMNPFIRAEPPLTEGDAEELRAVLQRLVPLRRAAYLLSQLEDLSDEDTATELIVAQAGSTGLERWVASDVPPVLSEVDDSARLSPYHQRELLEGPDFDPGRPRVSRRSPRAALTPRVTRRRAVVSVTVLVLVLAAGTTTYAAGDPKPWEELVTVPAGEWRNAEEGYGYDAWPTMGELRDDRGLLREAGRTWYEHGGGAELIVGGYPPSRWWPIRYESPSRSQNR